jgi:ribosomal protein S18 acetylase RimI-like enzyme
MSAITRSLPVKPASPHLRPFDVSRDLNAVADLVEACFADTLDEDGRRYVDQMHAAARNPRYLRWAMAVAENVSLPLTGYVWEENGSLVGNLSLIPYVNRGVRSYLIANVAVAPSHRRRGIARALTTTAIQHARKQGAREVWLHVREENLAAHSLYLSLDFKERARRTSWENGAKSSRRMAGEFPQLPEGVALITPAPAHWSQQRAWLQATYPPELTWHLPFRLHAHRPDVWGALYGFFTGTQIRQWGAVRGRTLLGVLGWQPHPGHADHLWLASSPQLEEQAVTALLPHLLRELPDRRRMVLDYPGGRARFAIEQAGFHIQQTLIWMQLKLKE